MTSHANGFFNRLEDRVTSSNSLLCIGLDPHVSQLSEATPDAAVRFCVDIITNTHQYAAAFKPNSAFFEAFGSAGFDALAKVIDAIPKDIPVILDCKRGDIDTTAQAYATYAYDAFNSSAVTLSPYMGWDSVHPFVTGQYCDRGAFILCKTSNPSSKDLQELRLASGQLLYEKVASVCSKWNDDSTNSGNGPCVGLVVGATDLLALQNIRKLNNKAWILCPGVGAQGGDAMDVCSVGLRSDASGLLVSVSRGISKAKDMAKAAAELRDDINKCRSLFLEQTASSSSSSSSTTVDLEEYQKSFIQFALSRNVLQFGSFKLKSGRISPYFFNAGLFCDGHSMRELSRSYAMAIRRTGLDFDVIFGPAYKGIPLATAVAVAWFDLYGENKDVSYNRKEAKDHGEGGVLVGAAINGKRVLIVDDVITAGTAIREAVDILNNAKANIIGVTVALDRQEKATDTSETSAIQEVEREYGFPVISIVQLKHLVAFASTDKGDAQHLESILQYRKLYGVQY